LKNLTWTNLTKVYILQFNISQRVEYVTDSRIRHHTYQRKRKLPHEPPSQSWGTPRNSLSSTSEWGWPQTGLFSLCGHLG